jgi:hypothetical protein
MGKLKSGVKQVLSLKFKNFFEDDFLGVDLDEEV